MAGRPGGRAAAEAARRLADGTVHAPRHNHEPNADLSWTIRPKSFARISPWPRPVLRRPRRPRCLPQAYSRRPVSVRRRPRHRPAHPAPGGRGSAHGRVVPAAGRSRPDRSRPRRVRMILMISSCMPATFLGTASAFGGGSGVRPHACARKTSPPLAIERRRHRP